MKLLLASQSMARRRMLEAADILFETISSSADEDAEKERLRREGADARMVAARLAGLKARGVTAGDDDLVLGCDQTLELADGRSFDKPRSRTEAEEQLKAMSGTAHMLHSAAAIVARQELVWSHVETVTLHMRSLSPQFLASYLDLEFEAIRHGVGGYRIEGPGAQLFDRIEGSHFAVLGLPLLPLLSYLRQRGLLAS